MVLVMVLGAVGWDEGPFELFHYPRGGGGGELVGTWRVIARRGSAAITSTMSQLCSFPGYQGCHPFSLRGTEIACGEASRIIMSCILQTPSLILSL